MAELGASFGFKRDVVLRSLKRLVRFRSAHLAELAVCEQDPCLVVHTRIPIVDVYHFERMSRTVRADHYRLVSELRATGEISVRRAAPLPAAARVPAVLRQSAGAGRILLLAACGRPSGPYRLQ
ncbi:MAG TPA: hypothetical protein VMD59_02725 [Acidimicrobiales bacterium]|nr:hypothetical protein [Acidimicrobiales bacterium]